MNPIVFVLACIGALTLVATVFLAVGIRFIDCLDSDGAGPVEAAHERTIDEQAEDYLRAVDSSFYDAAQLDWFPW